jgi:hypothetical protein
MFLFHTVIMFETTYRYFYALARMFPNKYKKTSVFVQTPDSFSNNEPFSVYGLPHHTALTETDENRGSCSESVWAVIVFVA